jgi:mono/diheme cytochrome c family protein
MADQILLGLFDNVTTTADAIDGLRDIGVEEDDITVMSGIPYAPKFLGRKPHRQWFFLFVIAGAVIGVVLGLFVAVITPELYPIHVGGQALVPVPPAAIIIFELTALCSMLAAFVGFLLQSKFPILTSQMYDERISEGYFGVEVTASADLAGQVAEVFTAHGAHDIKRDDAANYPPQGVRHLFFWGGAATVGLVVLLAPLLLTYDIVRIPWINVMQESPGVSHQEGPRLAVPPDSVPIQGPVLLGNEPATERIAGESSVARGDLLYDINCAMCHGQPGEDLGLVGKRHFLNDDGTPRVPHITSDRVQALPPEYVFWVITEGVGWMPSISENLDAGETWDIVNYVASLNPQAPADN